MKGLLVEDIRFWMPNDLSIHPEVIWSSRDGVVMDFGRVKISNCQSESLPHGPLGTAEIEQAMLIHLRTMLDQRIKALDSAVESEQQARVKERP